MKTHLISNRSRRRTHGLALILILLSLGIIYLLSSEMVSITGMVTVLDIAPQGFEFKDPGNISKGAVESEFNSVKQKISLMKEKELPTIFVDDVLKEATELN